MARVARPCVFVALRERLIKLLPPLMKTPHLSVGSSGMGKTHPAPPTPHEFPMLLDMSNAPCPMRTSG